MTVARPTPSRRLLVAARLRGLSIACFLLYAIAQVGAAISGWVEFVSEERQHGASPEILGPNGYAWTFLEQTWQNWQSEFLALTLLIALTAVLLHRGSKHSRDGSDEVKERVQDIEKRVKQLASRRAPASAG